MINTMGLSERIHLLHIFRVWWWNWVWYIISDSLDPKPVDMQRTDSHVVSFITVTRAVRSRMAVKSNRTKPHACLWMTSCCKMQRQWFNQWHSEASKVTTPLQLQISPSVFAWLYMSIWRDMGWATSCLLMINWDIVHLELGFSLQDSYIIVYI